MGNADVETGSFTTMHEKFNYSSAARIMEVSSSAVRRFTRAQIEAAVESKEPEQIATILYEGRNEGDLGNSEDGDGWHFHGRGFIQFTGRYNYKRYGDQLGIDLISDPELAADPEVSAKLALAFWDRVPQSLRMDPVAAGRAINGGKHAASRRLAAARAWATIITPELIRDIERGELSVEQLAAMGVAEIRSQRRARHDEVHRLQTSLNRLGHTDTQGHPLVADGDYGRRTRQAVEDFQRRHGLVADGIAGPLTLAAVHRAVEVETRSIGVPDAPYLRTPAPEEPVAAYRSLPPDPAPQVPILPVLPLDDPSHPDRDLYLDAQARVYELDRQHGRQPAQYSHNLSAALVVAARSEGLGRIDRVELRDGAATLCAFESCPGRPEKRTEVAVLASMNLPLAHSSQRWASAVQAFEQKEVQARERAPTWEAPPSAAWDLPASVPVTPDRNDPRYPESPHHALYSELRCRVPDASEDRLVQFTAACHEKGITAQNLSEVRLDEDAMTLTFIGTGALTMPAKIDLEAPPPYPEEAIAQIHQHDLQEELTMQLVREQIVQLSHGLGHSR
jgi:putative chitinase